MLRPFLCIASAASLATVALAQTPDDNSFTLADPRVPSAPATPAAPTAPSAPAASFVAPAAPSAPAVSPTPAASTTEPSLAEEITPFSVWLDFNVLAQADAERPALPVWFEEFQELRTAATNSEPPKTTFRLRLRRMPTLHRELLLRIYFDDLPEMQPSVSGWSETGRERFHSGPLGNGVALSTSESMVIPLDGVDYLDVQVAGDGSSIRGAFVSSLKSTTTLQTNDFQAPAAVIDPFGGAAPVVPDDQDKKLFGRVKALLDPGIVRLSKADGPSVDWPFQLAQQPLITVVSFEVLNADLASPPVVIANGGEAVYANVQWPDLADPGYRGEGRSLEPSMRFQYTGWLRAQAVIPGHLLQAGLNKITIGLSEDSGPIAVRNVELQLKQNWKHFDYKLSPVNP